MDDLPPKGTFFAKKVSNSSPRSRSPVTMVENPGIEQFIQLYSTYESRLRGYILSMVPRWSDAEDIGQRCSLIMWKKFAQFEPGTNFYAWACQIARLEVKEYRKRQSRDRVIFSDEFIDTVADDAMELQIELPERTVALQKCVEKLSPNHRELLRLRYDEQRSVGSVAGVVNRPVEVVYKALSRIRHALHVCINSQLAAGNS